MIVPEPGLCGTCQFGRAIVSGKGSRFVLCERSRTDAAFPRYPRLPVTACTGYEPVAGPDERPDLDASGGSLLDSADIPKNGL